MSKQIKVGTRMEFVLDDLYQSSVTVANIEAEIDTDNRNGYKTNVTLISSQGELTNRTLSSLYRSYKNGDLIIKEDYHE